MQHQSRKSSFKTPPIKELSQHSRREKALDEQKRKRAQCVDSSRNLDSFAGLSLGADDDEGEHEPEILREGVAHLASLLPSQSTTPEGSVGPSSKDRPHRPRKPKMQFANKIMYAELLEMKDDPMLFIDENVTDVDSSGLPVDLDTNWVALAPVPQGKRCMAVSNQFSNIPGTVPNTFLKSRLKGRTILAFPSPLPPATILDCILDENWKNNGIIHVLDLIRWKGQKIGDCEASFRFWWRDTRLSEIVSLPASLYVSHISPETASSLSPSAGPVTPRMFSYPTSFVPVAYHLDLSFPNLLSTIIPLSRATRQLTIQLPFHSALPYSSDVVDMEVDHTEQQVGLPLVTGIAEIQPDGLLLYVSQASYEPGTSPLSSWVPVKSYTEGHESPLALFERAKSIVFTDNGGKGWCRVWDGTMSQRWGTACTVTCS